MKLKTGIVGNQIAVSGKIDEVVNVLRNMQEFGTLGNFIEVQKEISDARNNKKLAI